jgi:hypothetical protein
MQTLRIDPLANLELFIDGQRRRFDVPGLAVAAVHREHLTTSTRCLTSATGERARPSVALP